MNIRDATAADAGAIAGFWNPMIRETLVTFNSTPKSSGDVGALIQERQMAGHGFFVAQDHETLLGFASYGQFRAGPGYAYTMEHTIIVAPEGQGRGIGRALMNAVESHARRAGAHSMLAGVSAENAAGIAFHEVAGYRTLSVILQVGRKFDRWLDLVLMQKFL